ncbi:PREDICTED: GDT1-like protein 1, chloroplastic [Tarenaya hassleriana]|uniref:GDT1-like protein 1, chloroplastic n=1 Tax=Tarenaya hassleriana TaxID=28532 RepID=UPI00053C3DBB|nr:PREDICTED: GDT1-like protein 1, chloroplastic [Tarenaya hassleriana]
MQNSTLSYSLHLPFRNPRPPKLDSSPLLGSCSSYSERVFSFRPFRFGFPGWGFSRCLGQWRGDQIRLGFLRFRRNAVDLQRALYLEGAEFENDLRNRPSMIIPSITHDLRRDAQRVLKFMPLFGLLAFQGTGPAFAVSETSGGLQSVISSLGDLGDISTGFASAFLLIFFSELGDKTFFIAALLAARNSAATVFAGTFGALAAMTIISVALGRTFHYVDEILPFKLGETDLPLDDIAAVCLLVYFGASTLLDASSDDGLKADEEQKEAELAVSELSGNGAGILAAANTFISTFVLVFVAEWGDKSFFSTIALAAASSPLGVIAGALAGHGVATLLAVLGGSLLGNFLSEKAIAYVGGVLFLVFAAVTLAEIIS